VLKVNLVTLGSGGGQYRLDDPAYELLYRYLAWTRGGLRDEPEREEALQDLEGLIGAHLAALLQAGERILTRADVESVCTDLAA
jgi:hypothetical protein